jgi:hypothetical protein
VFQSQSSNPTTAPSFIVPAPLSSVTSTLGSVELDNDDSDSSSVSDDDGYVSTSTITSPELKMIEAHSQVNSISKGTHFHLFLICLII